MPVDNPRAGAQQHRRPSGLVICRPSTERARRRITGPDERDPGELQRLGHRGRLRVGAGQRRRSVHGAEQQREADVVASAEIRSR